MLSIALQKLQNSQNLAALRGTGKKLTASATKASAALAMAAASARAKLKGDAWHRLVTLSDTPVSLPWFGTDFDISYGHAKSNAQGLKVEFVEASSGSCGGKWTPEAFVQNFPGNAHGGTTSAVLDETMGQSVFVETGALAVSTEMSMKWLRPVRIGTTYEIVTRRERLAPGLYFVQAVMRDIGQKKEHATAQAFYYQPSRKHARKMMNGLTAEAELWFRK